jgi:hypothetical protein
MKSLSVGVCIAALLTIGVPVAAQEPAVTITGCVLKGNVPDTFVLTDVKEVAQPAARPTDAPEETIPAVIYWLSTTKGLKEQVGHRVEVSGTVSQRVDQGKVKIDPKAGTVEVSSGLKKAEAKTETPVGTSGTVDKVEVKKPTQTLHVRTLRMVASSCQIAQQ